MVNFVFTRRYWRQIFRTERKKIDGLIAHAAYLIAAGYGGRAK